MNTNKPSKNKFRVSSFIKFWLPTFFWTVVVCYLSLTDSGLPGIKFRFILESDKYAHIAIYFVLTLLLIRSWANAFLTIKINYLLFFASVQSISYGILMEVLQKLLTHSRHFDLKDIYANIFGSIAAVTTYMVYRRFFSKEKSDIKSQ